MQIKPYHVLPVVNAWGGQPAQTYHTVYTHWHVGLYTKTGRIISFTTCKEYILDYTWMGMSENNAGFEDVHLDEAQLAVIGMCGNEKKALALIHHIEDRLGIPHTQIYWLDEINGGILFCGHKDWLIAPPMLSLYGLLIRIGRGFEGSIEEAARSKYAGNCWDWWGNIKDGLAAILQHGHKTIFGEDMLANWQAGTSAAGTHGCGIVYFSGGMRNDGIKQSAVSRWYKFMK